VNGPPRRPVERVWLDLLADLLDGPVPADVEQRVCGQLVDTFELAAATWSATDGRGGLASTWSAAPEVLTRRREIDAWTADGPHRHPVCRYYLATGDVRVVQVAELPRAVVDARCAAEWSERAGPWGIPHQLALPLESGPAGHRAFSLSRADPFTAQEVQLGATLLRLLAALDRRVARLRRADAAPALTGRERAVLDVLAQGLTAAAMARRLGVAQRTVNKHLQRIYAKLDAHDRLGAVLAAQRLGLLRPDVP
jgi:DNA-binding CsgD family transcriptional regulator